jgi:hypothetical protein
MAETKRAVRPAALDTASDHLGELLRHADELLLEWSKFGAGVRAQVDREAHQIGNAVCDAVDLAVRRAAAEGTARAITEQLGTQLAAVSAEVAKLESRARAASRAISEQRRGDRGLLYGLIAAVLIANALLVVMLVRTPAPVIVEPAPVAKPLDAIVPAPPPPKVELPPEPVDQALDPTSVPEAKPDAPSDPKVKPGKGSAEAKPELKAVPPLRPVKQGPPTGGRAAAKPISNPATRN